MVLVIYELMSHYPNAMQSSLFSIFFNDVNCILVCSISNVKQVSFKKQLYRFISVFTHIVLLNDVWLFLSGIINGSFSEDVLFLRQLILDGQWDDVIDFVQPLKTIESFDAKQFIYIVLKYQFLELLCLKTEAQIENDLSVEQIVK